MNSCEYDACDVTLSVYPHRASLKNMPDHGGNRTYDLWNTSPMLCQLSYARVCDISEQNLVPSISMLSNKLLLDNIDIEGTRFCSEISHIQFLPGKHSSSKTSFYLYRFYSKHISFLV